MKVLKSLTLSLLSLLLFFSLSVFGIAFALNGTLLSADFVASEVNRIDMTALTRELADTLIVPQLPQQASFLKDAIYAAVADFSPSLKDQIGTAVHSAYDYFQGRSQKLSITISFETLKTNLQSRARQAFLQNPPAQLAGLPPAQVDQYFNQQYQQYSQQIPPSFTLDETTMDRQTLAQVREVKQYVSYYDFGYKALIGFMVLLVLGIVLINRQVKSITRELGVNFLLYGALEYGGIIVAKYFLPTSLSLPQMPQALGTWVSQLVIDLMAPLQTFSLVLMVLGVVLTAVSFVYRPAQSRP